MHLWGEGFMKVVSIYTNLPCTNLPDVSQAFYWSVSGWGCSFYCRSSKSQFRRRAFLEVVYTVFD